MMALTDSDRFGTMAMAAGERTDHIKAELLRKAARRTSTLELRVDVTQAKAELEGLLAQLEAVLAMIAGVKAGLAEILPRDTEKPEGEQR